MLKLKLKKTMDNLINVWGNFVKPAIKPIIIEFKTLAGVATYSEKKEYIQTDPFNDSPPLFESDPTETQKVKKIYSDMILHRIDHSLYLSTSGVLKAKEIIRKNFPEYSQDPDLDYIYKLLEDVDKQQRNVLSELNKLKKNQIL
jgi:hypothetical protein